MVASSHNIQVDGDYRPCHACATQLPMSSNQAANDAGFLCNHHSSSVHEQYTTHGPFAHPQGVVVASGDTDLHTSLAPLSISGLSESSSDSHDTLKAATKVGRADLAHILGQDYFNVSEPNQLTENAMRALDFTYAHTYAPNTYGWVCNSDNYNLTPGTNAHLPQMTDSMLVSKPAKKSASSINTSSWYLVELSVEESSHATDQVVFAVGAQYENDTTYPYTIDDAISLGH